MKVLRRSFLSLLAAFPFSKALAGQAGQGNVLETEPEAPKGMIVVKFQGGNVDYQTLCQQLVDRVGYDQKCRCEACSKIPHYLVWVKREDAIQVGGTYFHGKMQLVSSLTELLFKPGYRDRKKYQILELRSFHETQCVVKHSGMISYHFIKK